MQFNRGNCSYSHPISQTEKQRPSEVKSPLPRSQEKDLHPHLTLALRCDINSPKFLISNPICFGLVPISALPA